LAGPQAGKGFNITPLTGFLFGAGFPKVNQLPVPYTVNTITGK
jgi:hypothetical protein